MDGVSAGCKRQEAQFTLVYTDSSLKTPEAQHGGLGPGVPTPPSLSPSPAFDASGWASFQLPRDEPGAQTCTSAGPNPGERVSASLCSFRESLVNSPQPARLLRRQNTMPWLVWLGWLEHHPANRREADSISGQGAYERQPTDISLLHRCFSPCLSPSLPLSLKSISMSLGKDLKKL